MSSHFKTWWGSRSTHHSDRSDDLRWAIWIGFKAQICVFFRHKDGWCFCCQCFYQKIRPQKIHLNTIAPTESNNKTFQLPSCFLAFGWHTPLCLQHVSDSLEGLWPSGTGVAAYGSNSCREGGATGANGVRLGANHDFLKIKKLRWWEERALWIMSHLQLQFFIRPGGVEGGCY